MLRFRSGGSLLEAGCGYGLFLREAAAHFECVGCDVSEHAIRRARDVVPARVPLLVSSLDSLALRRRFDVVAAFDAIEHVSALPAVFRSAEALLHPGGLLVFTVPVYDGPLGGWWTAWTTTAPRASRGQGFLAGPARPALRAAALHGRLALLPPRRPLSHDDVTLVAAAGHRGAGGGGEATHGLGHRLIRARCG